MPYFPKQPEQAYQCEGCKGWFYPSNMSCCVAHAPGSCCHQYEQSTLPPAKPSVPFTDPAAR